MCMFCPNQTGKQPGSFHNLLPVLAGITATSIRIHMNQCFLPEKAKETSVWMSLFWWARRDLNPHVRSEH